jgi:DNA-binding SARP family transcriptional activator
MARLSLSLLGGFEARLDGRGPLTLARHKVEALLAYLASQPGQLHRRDKLAALLWADAPSARARHSLRQALAELRLALSPVPACLGEWRDAVAIDAAAADVDVVTFDRLAADGSPGGLERAVALYRGDFLEGMRIAEPAFEEWLMAERHRLREMALDALAKLLARDLRASADGPAVQTALRLLALDPLQETVHRTLMRLYLRLGRRGAGLRQYEQCLDVLRRELSTEPDAATRAVYVELLQTLAVDDVMPPAAPLPDGALVGREADLARLRQAYEEAWRGGRAVVAVLGETGIGKTRLIEEFAAIVPGPEVRVLAGRAHETGSDLPFGLWIDTLRDGGALPDIARMVDDKRVPRTELARLFPELADTEAPAAVSADRAPLFEAMRQVIARLAPSRLLLVLEDLHWADEPSLRLLAFVLRRAASGTLLVVLSAREDEMPGATLLRQLLAELEREGRGVRLELSPLSRDATIRLVYSLARSSIEASDRARLADDVWKASEGNPFMVVETMRAIDEDAGAARGPALPLPQRAHDTIASRLDRLGERGRHLAALAAAIGRAFEFRVLQQAASVDSAEAAAAVEELVGRRLLHVVGERLDFCHDWIRRAVYDRVLPPLRPALHASIARVLEALHAGRPEEVSDQLAYHHARASEPVKAVAALRRYAEAACRRYALDEAVRALHEALEHAAHISASAGARTVIEVSLELAFVLSVIGRFEEIRERLAPLADAVDRVGDPAVAARYFCRVALTHSVLGEHAAAERMARRALADAEHARDPATQGTAHYVLAVKGFVNGRARDGADHARHAVSLLERSEDRAWLAQACWILGCNLLLLGEFDAAVEAEARMEAIADAIEDAGRQATAAWTSALIQATRGDVELARASAERGLARSPDLPNRACAGAIIAMLDAESGHPSRAIPVLEGAVRDLERFRIRQVTILLFLAEAYRLAGRSAEAREVASRTRETSARMSFPWATATAERALGRLALAERDEDRARAHFHAALRAFTAIPAPFEVGRTHLELAVLAPDRARHHLRAAHRRFVAARAPRYAERAERLAAGAS